MVPLKGYWRAFVIWFTKKERQQKNFNPNRLLMNILYLTISFLATLFVYKEVDFFNQYNLLFIRLGSTFLWVGLYFVIKYGIKSLKQIRNKHYNLSLGYKVLISLLIIILLVVIVLNPQATANSIQKGTEKFSISKFNPFSVSKLINDTNVVSPNSEGSSFDIRSLAKFLPEPWGFIIFWIVIVSILLYLLTKFVFKGTLPNWLIWLLVIIGIVMAFQFKIPYDHVALNDANLACNSNNQVTIKNTYFGAGSFFAQTEFSTACLEYKSSQCRPVCVQNKPNCQCEANLIDILFHQKGDWILGAFR